MSRLNWTQRGDGWHAGRYHIELAAPGLWVCSRRPSRPGDLPTIEMTSGSLQALKTRIERLEGRRRLSRRSAGYGIAFALSVLGTWLSMNWGHAVAPAGIVIFSLLGAVFALRAIDGVIERSWEALNLNYQ